MGGLQTAEDSKFFGISAAFDSFSNEGKELIIQYQAKYEKDIECGGGYLKIGPKLDDLTTFGDPTVYNIMFGPDKCGYTKRTHLIFNYKGKNVLKKSDLAYKQEGEGTSHVYRMPLSPDNTVRVDIDAKKPDDWDDEEDGEWEAPMKDNPEYKGDWNVKRISNPAYKGVWEAKKIATPAYVDDDEIYKYSDFGFIGFDLWQVKGGTIFDNIIICDDVAEADNFVKKWKALSEVEKAKKAEEDEAKKEAEKKTEDEAEDDDDEADDTEEE